MRAGWINLVLGIVTLASAVYDGIPPQEKRLPAYVCWVLAGVVNIGLGAYVISRKRRRSGE